MFRTAAYWSALFVAVLFVLTSIAVFFATYVDIWAHLERTRAFPWSELAAIAAFVLTALTTFSGIFFGWRLDRRQAKELQLKVTELESKLKSNRSLPKEDTNAAADSP